MSRQRLACLATWSIVVATLALAPAVASGQGTGASAAQPAG